MQWRAYSSTGCLFDVTDNIILTARVIYMSLARQCIHHYTALNTSDTPWPVMTDRNYLQQRPVDPHASTPPPLPGPLYAASRCHRSSVLAKLCPGCIALFILPAPSLRSCWVIYYTALLICAIVHVLWYQLIGPSNYDLII